MDSGVGSRLSETVLVAFVVAVLGAGSWWWVASAPASQSGVDGAAVALGHDPASSYFDPQTVIQQEIPPSVVVEPSNERLVGVGADALLSRVPNTVWRKTALLDETIMTVSWPVPVRPEVDYLLQCVCAGPDAMSVHVDGVLGGALHLLAKCEQPAVGMAIEFETRGDGDKPLVTVSVPEHGWGVPTIEVGLQLIVVP